METSIIILSSLCLFQFISNFFLLLTINKLKKAKNGLQKEKETIEQMLPGSKVTFEHRLVWKNTVSFSVFYEAEVLEVSNKLVKVKAYDFTTDSHLPNEIKQVNNHKNIIINFMQNKWIDKKLISPMVGKQFIRDHKIDEVLK